MRASLFFFLKNDGYLIFTFRNEISCKNNLTFIRKTHFTINKSQNKLQF